MVRMIFICSLVPLRSRLFCIVIAWVCTVPFDSVVRLSFLSS